MSSILRILQDPALVNEEEAINNMGSATPKGPSKSKGGASTSAKGAGNKKDGGEIKDKASERKTSISQISRRASTTINNNNNNRNSAKDGGEGNGANDDGTNDETDEATGSSRAKKSTVIRKALVIVDEDEPLVAKLPSTVPLSAAALAALTAKSPLKKPSERLQRIVALASTTTTGGQGAEMKYSAIFGQNRPSNTLAAQLKQWLSPQIAQRSNVVMIFTGYGKESFNVSAEFDLALVTILESLRGAVISATEAHQEMLSLMADEDTSLRSKIARVTAQRSLTEQQLMQGGGGGGSGSNSGGDSPYLNSLPEMAADGGDGITPMKQRSGRAGADSFRAGGNNSSTNRAHSAASMSSASPKSKYSLLMARLPRNAAELEVTQLANVSTPLLPRLNEVSSSHRASTSNGGGGEDGGTPSKVYLRYMRSRSPVGIRQGAATGTTKGNNGIKAGLMKAARTSPGYITIPFAPRLHEAFKDPFGFAIHMWVRADGMMDTARSMAILHVADPHDQLFMLRLLANTNDVASYERGQMLLTARDGQGKYIESVFTCDVCDEEWHQLSLFINPKNKTLAMSVDGRNCRSRILATDDIGPFEEPRRRVAYLGASPTDDFKGVSNTFAGFILDFQATVGGNKLVQHYPIARNEATYDRDEVVAKKKGGGKDASVVGGGGGGGADSSDALSLTAATFTDVDCEEVMFCKTAPYFDGRGACINVGSLGDWGFISSGTAIEFKMRTMNTAESMCVIGITDLAGKHGGFGVELNTGLHNTLQRHHMSVWFTDYDGSTVRAACDLTSDTFDDRWHTINIRLTDLPAAKFKIRLDNRPVETHTVCSAELPSNFTQYSTHVTVGCMNNRGRHERFFKGSLRAVRLSHLRGDEDDPYAWWPLDEGPHARIAWDTTGHGFSGSYESNAGERTAEWLPVGTEDESADQDLIDVSKLNVTRHSHNLVSLAIVAVSTMVNPRTGRTYEVLEDILNGTTLGELEPVPVRDFSFRVKRSDNRVFRTIPEDCYRPTDSAEYLSLFRQGIARAREEMPRAHIVVVFRLGDAMFTAVDLAAFTKSDKARLVVTPSHMNWADVTNTDGSTNKVNLAINGQLANVEKLLLRAGTRPQLFKRTQFLRDTEVPAKGPDMLSSILSFALMSSVEPTLLHMVQSLPPYQTHDEALHAMLMLQGMRVADQTHAALVLSRSWRGKMGRTVHRLKVKLKEDGQARKARAETLRKQYPKETLEKKVRHALIIKATSFFYDRIMPQPTVDMARDDVDKVSAMLQQMEYAVEVVLDPTVESFWKAVRAAKQNQQKSDASLLVYFIGYGAHDVFTQPPSTDQQLSWEEEAETLARAEVLAEHGEDWLDLWGSFWKQLTDLHKRESAAYEEAMMKLAKKGTKKKKAAGGKAVAEEQARMPPPMPKRESTEAQKRILAGWTSELAPKVTRRAASYAIGSSGGGAYGIGSASEDTSTRVLSLSAIAPFGIATSMSLGETTASSSFAPRTGLGQTARGFASSPNSPLSPGKAHLHDLAASPTSSRAHFTLGDDGDGSSKDARSASSAAFVPVGEAPLQPQTYLLVADSAAPFSSSNTILLAEVKNYIVGTKPRRGEHSILLYDCAQIPTATAAPPTGGFGGFIGASGEALHAVYQPTQQHALTYYFKRCFLGAAVECVRIGRHPTEPNTTLETASHYISTKLGKDAPHPARNLHVRWFGEFVGDCYLAPTLLTTKEDRRSRKTALAGKKSLTRLTVRWEGALISEFRSVLLSAISKHCRGASASSSSPQPELKRLDIDDDLVLEYAADPEESNGCDYNTLTRHPAAQIAAKEDIKRAFPDVPCLNLRVLYSHPARLRLSLLPPQVASCNSMEADGNLVSASLLGGGRDPKAIAAEYVQLLERRAAMVEEHTVSNGLSRFCEGRRLVAGGRIAKASITIRFLVSLTDEDATKLERLSRRAQHTFAERACLVGVHVLTEKENAWFEAEERLFALDEARRQAETKARLGREAELRRKAEEERTRLLEQKDRMLETLKHCKTTGKVSAEEFASFFSVPLTDAYMQCLESLTAMIGKATAALFRQHGLSEKLEKMLTVDLIPPTPVRPPAPTGVNIVTDSRLLLLAWRVVLLMAQYGAPIATAPTLQVLVASTFGGYQPNLSAPLIKAATQVLQGCDNAALNLNKAAPHELLVVENCTNNSTARAIAALRGREGSVVAIDGTVFSTSSAAAASLLASRQRLSIVAVGSAASAAKATANGGNNNNNNISGEEVRPLFSTLVRRWPAHLLPSEGTARDELEAAVARLAPTIADLVAAAGIKPMTAEERRRVLGTTTAAGGDGNGKGGQQKGEASPNAMYMSGTDDAASNCSSPRSSRKGSPRGGGGGGGGVGYKSDDDDALHDESLFSPSILFAEVESRCRASFEEYAALLAKHRQREKEHNEKEEEAAKKQQQQMLLDAEAAARTTVPTAAKTTAPNPTADGSSKQKNVQPTAAAGGGGGAPPQLELSHLASASPFSGFSAVPSSSSSGVYRVTPADLARLFDCTSTADQPPLTVLVSLSYAVIAFDPSYEAIAHDVIAYLSTRVVWAKEAMEVLGPAFKANAHLAPLRKRLAANWSADAKAQMWLLTDEERAPPPPPPPPPPVVEEPKRRKR